MIEANQIIQGDCLEIMKDIEDRSIDLVLTDPPYGIKMDKGFGGFGGFGEPIERRHYKDKWDQERPKKIYFNKMIQIAKKVMIFGGNFFSDYLPVGTHWIVWDKLNSMPSFGDCELIWTNIPRNSVKKYRFQYNGLLGKESERFHPTQKPLKLISKLIYDYSNEGDLVLDPFAGSCTTAVACYNTNRRYICIELDEGYCEKGRQRVIEAQRQIKLEFKQ